MENHENGSAWLQNGCRDLLLFKAPKLWCSEYIVFKLNSQTPELAGALYLSMYKKIARKGVPSRKPAAPTLHGKAQSQNTAFTNQENYDIFTLHANAPNTPAKSVIHQPRYRAFQPSSSTIRFAASVKPRYGSNSSRNPITSSVPARGASGSS